MPTLKRRPERFPPPARLVAVFIVLAGLAAFRLSSMPRGDGVFSYDASRRYRVERVIDGDTLLLEDGTRVRLLGVNTPETKHPTKPVDPLGLKAAEFTRRRVEGRYVRLEFDRERRDKYRRVLAYVYRDEWFLNEELIRNGFSRAETRFPYRNSMKKRFRRAESEARERKLGIWANQKRPQAE